MQQYKRDTLIQGKPISQWARELGLSSKALANRLNTGWRLEAALREPCRYKPRVISASTKLPPQIQTNDVVRFRGIEHTVGEWAARLGWSDEVLHKRIHKMPLSKALTPKSKSGKEARPVAAALAALEALVEPTPAPAAPSPVPQVSPQDAFTSLTRLAQEAGLAIIFVGRDSAVVAFRE